MRRIATALVCIGLALVAVAQSRRRAVTPTLEATTPQPPGMPLAGLSQAQLASFRQGMGTFGRPETVATGLGPVFNDVSCTACHTAPQPGGGSNRLVTRFGRTVNGSFDALASLGGSLVQSRGIGGREGSPHNFAPEIVPIQATVVAQRRTTPLWGLGLIEATPDSELVLLAAAEAARGDGTAGRVNMTDNIRAGTKTVGRFGWKAQVPTIEQFSGDALLNEEGITSPDFPNENCPQGDCALLTFNPSPGLNDGGAKVASLTDFMRMLAAPVRGPQNADTTDGEQIFESIGCTSCHVSTLTTGSSTLAPLDHKSYHAYSDFLLHDMGSLGDGIEMASATGSEARTAPLWGLRFVNRYLHDGRATTLQQAIAAHDGQGRAARDRFAALPLASQAKLIAFLNSL